MGKTENIWPNLLVPGAGKSGTTSLHSYLNQHPDIFMSTDKEPGYFDDITKDNISYYLSLFAKAKDYQYKGESSTSYMMSKDAIKRIKEKIINPKFIFILRNPIDRAYSHYNWLKGLGFEHLPFEEAFLQDKTRAFTSKEIIPTVGDKSYFQEGCYGHWITQYINSFDKENIHIILSESLRSQPLSTLNECFSFLSLKKLDALRPISANETKVLQNPQFYHQMRTLLSAERSSFWKKIYKNILPDNIRIKLRNLIIQGLEIYKSNLAKSEEFVPLTNTQRQWLAGYYADDVKALRAITNNDYTCWPDFN